MKAYNITPIPKPRMTRSDKWKKRDCVDRYWQFKDEVRQAEITLPESHYHVIFILPMPKSWSQKKRLEMDGRPHQQKPDKDNLEKALLDAIFTDDCRVWDGRVSKFWGLKGMIVIDAPELERGAA